METCSACGTQVRACSAERGQDVANLALARVVLAAAAVDEKVVLHIVDVRQDVRHAAAGQQEQQQRHELVGAAALDCAPCVSAHSGSSTLSQTEQFGPARWVRQSPLCCRQQ